MKGRLEKELDEWVIIYNELEGEGYKLNSLPLYPDDLKGRRYLINNAEVEFENMFGCL